MTGAASTLSTASTGFRAQLLAAQDRNASLLCVGLDPEPARFPLPWQGDPARIFDFCAAIVAATRDIVCAYKPQIAYFAAQRAEDQLERLVAHIHATAPGVPVILDAKRGDIGATAAQYAREAFERYQADALTLSPFMGLDSIEPYMRYAGKGLLLLCRTSNPGGSDLQAQALAPAPGQPAELLYERIARLAAGAWNRGGQIGLVVGATYPQELARVRALAPTLPLLIPGVGAQGGDVLATVRAGWRGNGVAGAITGAMAGVATGAITGAITGVKTGAVTGAVTGAMTGADTCGPVIVSASRAVLYAAVPGQGDFAAAARGAALALREQLEQARQQAGPQAQAHDADH